MRSFVAALAVFAILIGGILTVNTFAARRIDAYLGSLPSEEEALDAAALRLEEMLTDMDRRLWLLNGCIHHEKTEELMVLLSAAKAAAEANDEEEYALNLAQLRQRLRTVKTEFILTVKDLL